jgi:hypothetical protein
MTKIVLHEPSTLRNVVMSSLDYKNYHNMLLFSSGKEQPWWIPLHCVFSEALLQQACYKHKSWIPNCKENGKVIFYTQVINMQKIPNNILTREPFPVKKFLSKVPITKLTPVTGPRETASNWVLCPASGYAA